jgi:hypothetical protein
MFAVMDYDAANWVGPSYYFYLSCCYLLLLFAVVNDNDDFVVHCKVLLIAEL